jgi:hypothetical protein
LQALRNVIHYPEKITSGRQAQCNISSIGPAIAKYIDEHIKSQALSEPNPSHSDTISAQAFQETEGSQLKRSMNNSG